MWGAIQVWGQPATDTERYMPDDSLTITSIYDNPNFLDDSHVQWMIDDLWPPVIVLCNYQYFGVHLTSNRGYTKFGQDASSRHLCDFLIIPLHTAGHSTCQCRRRNY